MAGDPNDRRAQAGGVPVCPRCGRALGVRLLEFLNDRGGPETLLLLDCPTGDFRGTVTWEALLECFTAEVVKRLREPPLSRWLRAFAAPCLSLGTF